MSLVRLIALACFLLSAFAFGQGANGSLPHPPLPPSAHRGGMGGGRPPMMGMPFFAGRILERSDVQQDLKLSAAQKASLDQLSASSGRDMRAPQQQMDMAKRQDEFHAKVRKILSPAQWTRLQQIQRQLSGSFALTQPDNAKELGLSEAQKTKMTQVLMSQFGQGHQVLPKPGEDFHKQMLAQRAAMKVKLMAILTPAQKLKWAKMNGPAFKGATD